MVLANKKIGEFDIYLKTSNVLVVYHRQVISYATHYYGGHKKARVFFNDLTSCRSLDHDYIFRRAKVMGLSREGISGYQVKNGVVQIW